MAKIPVHIKYIFKVYCLALFIFTIFRLILFLAEHQQMHQIMEGRGWISLQAFLMGLRFDVVISGYILSLPMLVLTGLAIANIHNKNIFIGINFYTGLLFSIAFLICAIDIPYYGHFGSRLTSSALAWTNTPGFVLKMVFQEYRYWIYLIPLILLLFLFWVILLWIRNGTFFRRLRRPRITPNRAEVLSIFGLSIVVMGFMFLGIRGRTSRFPINVGTAYFCNYAFPNQLGLNPVFTLAGSIIYDHNPANRGLHLMDNNQAIELSRKYLNIKGINGSPLSRPVIGSQLPAPNSQLPNVVVVIMESMGAYNMSRYGNTDALTPCLDSLAQHGLSFDNTYTSGIHTHNGIFATLFGMPALLKEHMMYRLPTLNCSGLSNTLSNKGYQTLMFVTHDDHFDNTGGFLRANAFQEIIGQKDYPSGHILSVLGVPDHYMFEYSIDRLNKLHDNNKPFLAAYMTSSNHGPYLIPENIPFKAHSTDPLKAEVEYCDWSVKHFLDLASQQKWYSNTIFVFIADHGVDIGDGYDMPLYYHHTPFIVYAPGIIKEPKVYTSPAGQIDVFPTIMGLLEIPYVNNTMGIDLRRDHRPCIYFTADDKVGCIDEEFFYLYRVQGPQSLYRYKTKDMNDYLPAYAARADSLKNYAFSMLQTAQYMVDKGLTGKPVK